MKFMLPVLFSFFITTTLFSQKLSGAENSVTTTKSTQITNVNTPNQTETITWERLFSSGYSGVYGGSSLKVNALLVVGSTVYIAGTFQSAGGSIVTNIVMWDGSSMSPLLTGVDGTVNALAYYNGKLIVGGSFGSVGSNENIKYIAQWNGSSWSSVGGGVNLIVYALTVANDVLYVAGDFTHANSQEGFNRIASWNGSTWTAYGSGFTHPVKALAVSGETIYAGGQFTESGGNPGNYIAKWTGSSWSSLGTGMDGNVYSLAISGSDLYAGGAFNYAGGTSAYYIAKWTGSAWSALSGSVASQVNVIVTHNSIIYAGTNLNVMKYKANNWSSIAHSLDVVKSLAVNVSDQAMYVGGEFQSVRPTEDPSTIELNRVGKFTDTDDPLPVELTSFSAKRVSDGVELRWTTATEVNNYGFEIERATAVEPMHASSLQNRNWQKINFVSGHGNSNSPKQYIYKDNCNTDEGYIYRLKQIDSDGSFSYSGELHVGSGALASFDLNQNFPNPFNPATMISYSLPSSGMVQLKIYNTTGEEVSSPVNEIQDAGSYQIGFNATGLASGTYLYRITVTTNAGIYTQSRKMVLLK